MTSEKADSALREAVEFDIEIVPKKKKKKTNTNIDIAELEDLLIG